MEYFVLQMQNIKNLKIMICEEKIYMTIRRKSLVEIQDLKCAFGPHFIVGTIWILASMTRF
jgi:hypothetical protein